jgi:hypothetical protein
MMVMMSCAKDS